jgi:hypothetical protein
VDTTSYYEKVNRSARLTLFVNDYNVKGNRSNGPGVIPPPPAKQVHIVSDEDSSDDERPAKHRARQSAELPWDLPTCACDECRSRRPHPPEGFPWARYDVLDPRNPHPADQKNEDLLRHRWFLCSSELWGLVLKTRKWGQSRLFIRKRPYFVAAWTSANRLSKQSFLT